MQPGTYDNLSAEDYHADTESISKSGLSRLYDNPARYRYGTPQQTKALSFGQLVHAVVLEPETVDARFLASALARFTETDSKYKDEVIRAAGRTIVKKADFDIARRISDSVQANRVASAFITPSLIVERTLCWNDPLTGVRLRARPDGIARADRVLLDLKTCEDAGSAAFAKSAHAYRYNWQPVIYGDGISRTEAWTPAAFIFIAVEKEAPYLTATYELVDTALDLARRQIDEALSTYADCLASDEWAGHGPGLTKLDLPYYAYRDNASFRGN